MNIIHLTHQEQQPVYSVAEISDKNAPLSNPNNSTTGGVPGMSQPGVQVEALQTGLGTSVPQGFCNEWAAPSNSAFSVTKITVPRKTVSFVINGLFSPRIEDRYFQQ